MVQVFSLLVAAAAVGVLHMSAPDHWVTLCILGQRSSWSRARTLWFGAATAVGHVTLSLALGLLIVAAGMYFSRTLSDLLTVGTGAVMVVGGLIYGFRVLLRDEPEDYEREASEEAAKLKASGRGLGFFAVLGGALSPDLSVLPVFLLASQVSVGMVADTALTFATASVFTLLLLVLAGSEGLAKLLSKAPAKYNDSLVGFVIAAVGAYILLFG
ncbi:MAG: hypothetical protein JRM73_01410 [Nitrososphaerota archaeon]|nr:hypothetical protein [Nitrososphaerota archaeon]